MAAGRRWRQIRGLASRSVFLVGVLVLAGVLANSALAVTITVTTDSDVLDANGSSCAGMTTASLPGPDTLVSLREAICAANGTVGTDTIGFAIPGGGPFVILMASDLPAIVDQVTINGYTEPGSSANTQAALAGGTDAIIQIQIDGLGGAARGLQFSTGSTGSTVSGLSITNYTTAGIQVDAGVTGIGIQGNFIGMAAPAGAVATGNGAGILLDEAATVGGASAADRNLISGNGQAGIYAGSGDGGLIQGNLIGTDPTATGAAPNGTSGISVDTDIVNLAIGNATLGNVISGNTSVGVEVNSANVVTIQGNRIGTNGAGTAAVGNSGGGIIIIGGASMTVGGTAAGAGNLISGNDIIGVAGLFTTSLHLEGNRIGLNLDGTAGIPNVGPGVGLLNTEGAVLGGGASGARNVISGNDADGVLLLTLSGLTSPVIQGNRIGTSADGLTAIPNGTTGISLNGDGGGTLIGGSGAGEGNLISGNLAPGVDLLDSVGATLQGNIIGLNATETAALPNGVGGIFVCGCSGPVLIGGTAVTAGNVISGNVDDGIYLDTVTGATIYNNRIGTNSAGTGVFGNQRDGIRMEFGATTNIVGGTGTNQANIIANNAAVGVNVLDATSVGNAIRGNAIRDNGFLGIDLDDDDVTANDANDADAGPNDFQNFPVLTNALLVGGTTQVAGSLASTASGTFAIDVFASPSCDVLGHGEGSLYLGTTSVSTDGAGLATFDQPFAAAPANSVITATATRNNGMGSTSEFSACLPLLTSTPTPSATPTVTLTPTVTMTPTITPTGTLPTATATATPSPTSTPTPTPTPTLPALQPTGDDSGAPAGGNRSREKEHELPRTEEQRQQDQRTNQYGQDQYRTEGNVTELRTVNGEPAVILANRDGNVVVILRCGNECPPIKVGDYIIAEGEKEHEQLFFAESISIQKP